MKTFIHEPPDWPNFRWDKAQLADRLAQVRHQQGRLIGHMEGLGFKLRQEALLKTLTQDVVKTSEIEGEILDAEEVRSSIARRLGMDIGGLPSSDRNVEGIVEMMLDATRKYQKPLTRDRLFGWHAALFPTSFSGLSRINAGMWRNDAGGPVQVVSGPHGKTTVHFEAPAAPLLEKEMSRFLEAFNADDVTDPVIKAALFHLWFVTVHPFDDGNGRIARAIADMQLARSEGSPQRFYSMSAQIRLERKAYYQILERTQDETMDVTAWMEWFLGCLSRAIEGSHILLTTVLFKARFWESVEGVDLNDRQRLMLNRLLDGFEGKLTNARWAKLAKCSSDTALRDLQYLVDRGILKLGPEGGRSTSYMLAAQE